MSKPRVVEVKDKEKKPRVIKTEEEDFSLLVGGEASQELRKQHLRDISPHQPSTSDKLEISDEVRRKIDVDRRKRRGLVGDVKDLLGLR